MYKNYNKQKNKSGFTLIEVIISLAILSIVLGTAYSINLFGLKSYSNSNERSDNQFSVRMASDFITRKLRYADNVSISNIETLPSKENGFYYLFVQNGQIKFFDGNTEVQIPGVSDASGYTLNFEKKLNTMNVVNFKVGKSGTSSYDITTEVSSLNQNLTTISGTTGNLIKFKLNRAESIKSYTISGYNTPTFYTVIKNAYFVMPSRVNVNIDYNSGGSSVRSVPINWDTNIINTGGITAHPHIIVRGSVVGYNDLTVTVQVVEDKIKNNPIKITESALLGTIYSPPTHVNVETINSGYQMVQVLWENSESIPINTISDIILNGTLDGYKDALNADVTVELTIKPLNLIIVSVENKTLQPIEQGGTVMFPTQLLATYDNGTTGNVNVSWNNTSTVNNEIPGTYVVIGSVSGYAYPVYLNVTITQAKLKTPNYIIKSINTNSKQADIEIYNAQIGSTIYAKKSDGTNVVNGIVINNEGKALFNNIKYDQISYFVLEKQNWLPSDPLNFVQP
jgi:prepilin-type N-terminal cleavage/methylation domain-containing protein